MNDIFGSEKRAPEMNAPTFGLTFPHTWQVEVLPARPAILPARHFVYPREVDEIERGALEVLVRPDEPGSAPFLATCALGFRDPAVPTGIWSMPNPHSAATPLSYQNIPEPSPSAGHLRTFLKIYAAAKTDRQTLIVLASFKEDHQHEAQAMQTETIYMYLPDEGVEVWRPVQAGKLGDDVYHVVGPAPDGEVWEFRPVPSSECS